MAIECSTPFTTELLTINWTFDVDHADDDDDDIRVSGTWSIAAQVLVMGAVTACIILTNVVNLAVLGTLKTSMPWATRLFLINLSVSDLLVGVIACAPSVVSAATGRWIYGETWCQVSGVTHGTSVTISIWSISMVGLYRYAATALPIRYRNLVTRSWRYYVFIAALWTTALATFTAPLFTKNDLIYYRYSESQKMCGLHWEYPTFAIVTGLYIPILSGVVLVFTGFGINSTLRRRIPTVIGSPRRPLPNASLCRVQPDRNESIGIRLGRRDATNTSSAIDESTTEDVARKTTDCWFRRSALPLPLQLPIVEPSSAPVGGGHRSVRHWNRGSRRTLRIVIFTGIAYFVCWGPYSTIVFAKCFAPTLRLPPVVEFSCIWLANANSGFNVFIYSSTNVAFRRQCVQLASCLCCCRCNLRDGRCPQQQQQQSVVVDRR